MKKHGLILLVLSVLGAVTSALSTRQCGHPALTQALDRTQDCLARLGQQLLREVGKLCNSDIIYSDLKS